MTGAGGRRIAVVVFNLGGPDSATTVRPFLFNLFNDKAIIGLPNPFRALLAWLISSRRDKPARANYALMGTEWNGGSPLLPQTQAQTAALEAVLADRMPGDTVRVFTAMRYWHPMTAETATRVTAWKPDELVLLPLYPQFSTTTTESSLKAWNETYKGPGVARTVCCYPQAPGWIETQAAAIRARLDEAGDRPMRVLFSAHGIPESLVTRKGDPYQEQVEAGCAAVAARAGLSDWAVCYQSRVGPMAWLGPSTPDAICQAAVDGVGVVIAPIAFVSEHIETLVELDIEYAELAEQVGLHPYLRVPTPGTAAPFIETLSAATLEALGRTGAAPFGPGCQGDWKACPCQAERRAA